MILENINGPMLVRRTAEASQVRTPRVAPDALGTGVSAGPSAVAEDVPLEQAVNGVNQAIQNVQRDLVLTVDEETEKTVIKVVDQETGETIRQFPPEEVLKIAERLDEMMGLLFTEQA